MSKHIWMTETRVSEIEKDAMDMQFMPSRSGVRFIIADWRGMRVLLERLAGVRLVDELPEAVAIWDDITDMLDVTADEKSLAQ